MGDFFSSYEVRLQTLQRQVENSHLTGDVSEVKYDQEKKRWLVKVRDGDEGDKDQVVHTDWIPWRSFSHGTIQISMPPREGMKVSVQSRNGEFEQGVAEPHFNGPDTPSPHGEPDKYCMLITDPKGGQGSGSATGHSDIGTSGADDERKHVQVLASSDNNTLSTTGVKQRTAQKDVAEAVQNTITRSTGTDDLNKAVEGDGGGSGGNLPHELNAQLQGLRAEVTQHTHHIAALHDQASSIIDLALPKVPQLAALMPFLNHQPQGLQMAADGVLGKLEQYVSFSMQQAVAKLTSSFMGSVMSIASGNITDQIGSSLGQLSGLAGASDAAHATSGALLSAQTVASSLVVPASTSSGSGTAGATATVDLAPLVAALRPIVLAFAGTACEDDVNDIAIGIEALSPASAAGMATVNGLMNQLAGIYADNAGPGNLSDLIADAIDEAAILAEEGGAVDAEAIVAALLPVAPAFAGAAASGDASGLLGRIAGIAGAASGLMAGLGGMTDAQQNIPKGQTKGYRLGGYGSGTGGIGSDAVAGGTASSPASGSGGIGSDAVAGGTPQGGTTTTPSNSSPPSVVTSA